MIKTKDDLKYYLLCDKVARGEEKARPALIGDRLWKYQILMRKSEFHRNNSGILHKLGYVWYYARYRKISRELCSEIPLNVFGEGLVIWHGQNIIVNDTAKVGRNFSISNSCCIGMGTGGVPVIGDNVEMTIGSRIIGGITITHDVTVGAGALVLKSIDTPFTTWGGLPAKCISTKPNEYVAGKKERLTGIFR